MIEIVITLVLAGVMIAGVTHIAFQALAHVFMGWLARDVWNWRRWRKNLAIPPSTRLNSWLFVILCTVEICCFLWYRVIKGQP